MDRLPHQQFMLSDKAVKALKEQDNKFKPTKADEKARDAIASDVEKCVTG